MMDRFLSTIEPFNRLAAAERVRLTHVAREKEYAKGETIFREGAEADAVWVVRTGRVHLTRFLRDGKASTTCVMAPGEAFCCLPSLDRGPYPADAIAAEPSHVICIPLDAFQAAMAKSPAFLRGTLCLFCSRLREVEHKGCMLYESAEARLAQVLLSLSKKFGNTIPMTRHELAELAGTTHETAIRILSRFKARGLISSSRGETRLLKAKQLSALLERI